MMSLNCIFSRNILLILNMFQELQAEMENHIEHLQQLKDYDEHLAYEKESRAQEMQERKRVEVS